jgi:hypothetical protein
MQAQADAQNERNRRAITPDRHEMNGTQAARYLH